MSQIEECYNLLQTWHLAFPSGMKPKEREALSESVDQSCSPTTLKEARETVARQISKHRASANEPIHLETLIVHPSIMETAKVIAEKEGLDDDELDFEDMGEIIQRE
ncbi:hypothetical protein DFQ30_002007 [Apophysomyces sp. BC1015]|nr:hypothetical protein DFQ30_002007 [Apophysomyces sp. BC1015]